jgi:hypothetical protein
MQIKISGIPEPNTVVLVIGAIAMLACGLRRRLV